MGGRRITELLFFTCSGYYALSFGFEREIIVQKGDMYRCCSSRVFLILQKSIQETTGNHLLGIGYGLIVASFYAALTLTNIFI